MRLFRRPEEESLDRLGEDQKLILASVAWHESISPDEAVLALRYPHAACEDSLHMLRDRGALDDHGGRFPIAVAWWPALTRYLRRKHMIET